MSQRLYLIDNLKHWVYALSLPWPSNPDGYDIGYMCEGFEDEPQADLATIYNILEEEDWLNAKHQNLYWNYIDGAADAIGMIEADSYNLSAKGEISRSTYEEAQHRKKQEEYVSRVRDKIERVVNQYINVPITYEAVPEDPDDMGEAIAQLNRVNRHILNNSGWERQKDKIIRDAVSFGSGVVYTPYREEMDVVEDTWFEEKLRQTGKMDPSEFKRFHQLLKQVEVTHLDTFSVIRHRHARGPQSASFNDPCHAVATHVEQKRISELENEYPHLQGKIKPSFNKIHTWVNPRTFDWSNNHYTATRFRTWLRMPVRYTLDVPIEVAPGIISHKRVNRRRYAIVRVDRIENAGIADMCIDEYAHNKFPLDQFVHTTSSKHGCGIGLCKYGRGPQRIWNIMLNGALRYYGRMTKGGGFYAIGAMDPETLDKRSKEGNWLGIDYSKLPDHLQDKPLEHLVMDNRPPPMPPVYEQLMSRADEAASRTMGTPDVSVGIKQGNSAKQENQLRQAAEQVTSTGLRGFENMQPEFGEKVHSNIVQFLGSEELTARIKNPDTGDQEEVALNQIISEYPEYDWFNDKLRWVRVIRNNLQTLRFSTQLATQPVLPNQPHERQIAMQNLMNVIYPYLQSPEGLIALRYLNKHGLGNIPGLSDLIDRIEAMQQQQMQQQMQQQAEQQQWERQKEAAELNMEAEDRIQNKQRLDQNYSAELQKILGDYDKEKLKQIASGVEEGEAARSGASPQGGETH